MEVFFFSMVWGEEEEEPPSETDERDTLDSRRRRCCEVSDGSPATTSRADDHDVARLWDRAFRALAGWVVVVVFWLFCKLRDEVLDLVAPGGMGAKRTGGGGDYVRDEETRLKGTDSQAAGRRKVNDANGRISEYFSGSD